MSAEENEMKNRHPADENEKTMPETGADSFAAGEETDFVRMPGSREAARPARRKTIRRDGQRERRCRGAERRRQRKAGRRFQ